LLTGGNGGGISAGPAGRRSKSSDNRKVDFSNALIFMTSNISAAEMSLLVSPKLGFQVSAPDNSNGAPALIAS
jgi:hypothetical protein